MQLVYSAGLLCLYVGAFANERHFVFTTRIIAVISEAERAREAGRLWAYRMTWQTEDR